MALVGTVTTFLLYSKKPYLMDSLVILLFNMGVVVVAAPPRLLSSIYISSNSRIPAASLSSLILNADVGLVPFTRFY